MSCPHFCRFQYRSSRRFIRIFSLRQRMRWENSGMRWLDSDKGVNYFWAFLSHDPGYIHIMFSLGTIFVKNFFTLVRTLRIEWLVNALNLWAHPYKIKVRGWMYLWYFLAASLNESMKILTLVGNTCWASDLIWPSSRGFLKSTL